MSRVELDFSRLRLSTGPVSSLRLSDIQTLEGAGARPGSIALVFGGGYRTAEPSRLVVALMVRCAMQAELAKAAVAQLGHVHILEKRGFWPQSDKPYECVPSTLSAAVANLLEYIRWFSVEDDSSLAAFMQACEAVLAQTGLCPSEAAGNKARDAVRQYLEAMHRVARDVLCDFDK